MIDIAAIVPWLSAVALIISIAAAVSTYLSRGTKEAVKKIADVEGDVEDLTRRVQKLESDVGHLPDKDAVHRLELGLAALQTDIVKIGASAEQSARTSARVEQYLMDNRP